MQQLLSLISWRLLRKPRVQNRQQLSASVTVSILDQSLWPEKHDWHSFPETTWFEGPYPKIIFGATLWSWTSSSSLVCHEPVHFYFFSQESLICVFVPWNQSPDSCRWMAEDTVALLACWGPVQKKGLGGLWRLAKLGASPRLYLFNLLSETGENWGLQAHSHQAGLGIAIFLDLHGTV